MKTLENQQKLPGILTKNTVNSPLNQKHQTHLQTNTQKKNTKNSEHIQQKTVQRPSPTHFFLPRFTTFTEADLALRARAEAENGRVSRQRFAEGKAEGEVPHTVEDPRNWVSKGCCLEVFKYLRASKKHSFVTPGWGFWTLLVLLFWRFFFIFGLTKRPFGDDFFYFF